MITGCISTFLSLLLIFKCDLRDPVLWIFTDFCCNSPCTDFISFCAPVPLFHAGLADCAVVSCSVCWHREQAELPLWPGAAVPGPAQVLWELRGSDGQPGDHQHRAQQRPLLPEGKQAALPPLLLCLGEQPWVLGWKRPGISLTSSAVMEEDDKRPGMCREQEQCHCCDRCSECESFRFIQEVGGESWDTGRWHLTGLSLCVASRLQVTGQVRWGLGRPENHAAKHWTGEANPNKKLAMDWLID